MRYANVTLKFQLPPEPRHRCKTILPLYSVPRDVRLSHQRIATFFRCIV